MKKNISILIVVLSGIILSSCSKKTDLKTKYTYINPGLSYIKIVHAAPSFRQVSGAYKDSFNVYVSSGKVNSGFLTYASLFPSGNAYSAVPTGQQSIRLALQGTLTPDSVTLATLNKTLEADAFYSLIVTDSVLKNNEARQIFTRDVFSPTDTSHFTLKFVNAVLDDAANVDIYSTQYGTNIFTNIAPGMATSFVQLNYTVATDVLSVRRAGTTTELAKLSGASFARTRAYTILYRGQANVTTGTRARTLIQYTNL